MDWKNEFSDIILERGYDYYMEDRVNIIKFTRSNVSAFVRGYDNYDVEIKLSNGEISSMYCNCPYAQEGHNCKHMAAVLYEIEDDLDNDEEIACEPNEAIVELINNQSIDVLRKFVISVTTNNNDYIQKFKLMTKQPLTNKDIIYYENIIKNIKKRYLNAYSYEIDIDGLGDELNDFIFEKIDELITNQKYKIVINLLSKIMQIIFELDEIYGSVEETISNCINSYYEILKNSSDYKAQIFNHLLECLQNNLFGYQIIDLVSEYYQEDEYKNKILKKIKKLI